MSTDSFITGFSDLHTSRSGSPRNKAFHEDWSLISRFKLNRDVSPLFPYINAVAQDAVYYEKPVFIKFTFEDHLCALYPETGAAAPFNNYRQAHEFMERLIDYLNDLHSRRETINPSHRKFRPVNVLDILRMLPRTNCRECGYTTCMAFAAALSMRDTVPDKCPGLNRPISESAVYPVYDNQGNLQSTVTIDIDTSKTRHALMTKQERIENLEERLSHISRDSHAEKGGKPVGNDRLPAPLTNREIEVLRLMAHGATNKEISDLLGISPHTAKSHVIHIFNKLGVNDRTQAAVWATRNNLV